MGGRQRPPAASTKNTRKTKSKSPPVKIMNKYIPDDLQEMILVRLPAKSLLRFNCVCKSWYNLIRSHNFQQLHLGIFKNNLDRNFLLSSGVTDNPHLCIRHSDTFDQVKHKPEWHLSESVFGYVDGILLTHTRGTPNERISLWNLSINKVIDIGIPVEINWRIHKWFGFGLDTLTDTYKVVAIYNMYNVSSSYLSYQVYDLRSGTWSSQKKIVSTIHDLDKYFGIPCQWMTYFEGGVYWLPYVGRKSDTQLHTRLLGFNLRDEQVSKIELPEEKDYQLKSSDERWGSRLSVSNEKLMVLRFCNGKHVCVWAKEKDSWVKMYDVDLPFEEFMLLKSYGGLMFQNSSASRRANLQTYIPADRDSKYRKRIVCVYEESLVMLEQFIRHGKQVNRRNSICFR